MKILFLTNIPSPYRVAFFEELGKLCDLTVLFEKKASDERDASWKQFQAKSFKPVFLHGIRSRTDAAFCPGVVRYLNKNRFDRIIVTNFSSPTGMLAILWLRMKKIPYWLESDGAFAGSGVGMKEKIKTYFIKGAEGYFSTAQEHDRYYLQYGAREDRLYRYPFTSVYERDILKEPVQEEEKNELRKKLDIREKQVLITVGQFIHRKGFDVLLNAMAQLPKELGCYIVGGQPTDAYIEQAERANLSNVHFVGFQTKNALAEYYMASDIMVLPTREDIWGLVVNEAMAKGLPVITTDRCVAGLQLITKPALGQIVPAEDAQALAEAISRAFERMDAQQSQQVLDAISKYTVEQMAKRHIEVFTEQENG